MSDTPTLIVQCDHDWQIIGSNTLDVGEPSKWCPKCGWLTSPLVGVPEKESSNE